MSPPPSSLKRELQVIKAELAKLTQRYTKQGSELAAMDKERADLIAALATMSMRANKSDVIISAIRSDLRPVLAYFGGQWISDKVRAEHRRVVDFAKGNSDE